MTNQATLLPFLELLEEEVIEFKNLIEFSALLLGHKEVIRLVLNPQSIARLQLFTNQYYPDFLITISSFVLEDVFNSESFDRFQRRIFHSEDTDKERVLFIGYDAAVVEAWQIEEDGCEDHLTAKRYSYPECCGKTYARISKKERWIDVFFEGLQNYALLNPLANRFAGITNPWLTYHFDYFPCSVNCQHTLDLCRKNREMIIDSDLSEFIPLIDAHLSGVIILFGDSIWYLRLDRMVLKAWASEMGINPIVQSAEKINSKLLGLKLHEHSASAYIDSQWHHTDQTDLKVYVFEW